MDRRMWGALAVLVVAFRGPAEAAATCAVPSATGSILGHQDSCPALEPVWDPLGVVEGDEVGLQRALKIVHNNIEDYVAILFYASWCPFSKLCRPNYSMVSSLFPSIHHFAFEESVIRPSILSRYGVHGFPTLFLLNSTMRVRYHGSRTINSLVAFYTDVTGIKPSSLDPKSLERIVDPSNFTDFKKGTEHESCPFSWSRPEKLLQQDMYLALAGSFVLLRLLYFLFPKLNACILRAWRRHIQYASLMSLWDYPQAYIEQAKQSFNRFNPCKRGFAGRSNECQGMGIEVAGFSVHW